MADTLYPNDTLIAGTPQASITSQDRRFEFVLQQDGNLVLYRKGGRAYWATGTNGQRVAQAIMQSDGNFVLYGPSGQVIWASNTHGHANARLTVRNDGNVVIYDAQGCARWATNVRDQSVGPRGFLPSVSAFRFTNSFAANTLRSIPGISNTPVPASYGMCGGMAFAARDYFESGRPLPPDEVPPSSGALHDYLWHRLEDSFNLPGGAAQWAALMNPDLPDHETDLSRIGLAPHGRAWVMIKEEWPKIQDDLDHGRLSPIGLVWLKSYNLFDVFNNHQVLAYAYERVGDDVWIFVYDPNACATAGNTNQIAISLNLAHPEHTTAVDYSGDALGHRICCFFRPDYYAISPISLSQTKLVSKVTLSDFSDSSPALASLPAQLYLAWRGARDKLNVMCSTDGGTTFGNKYTAAEKSSAAPALCAHGAQVLIAWRGSGNDQLNVASLSRTGGAVTGIAGKVTLGDTSPSSPALASLRGKLYLAWRGGDNRLNVMSSEDGGRTFGHKHTSSERSDEAPALCAHNGELFIAWKGDGNTSLNVAGVARSGDNTGITGLVNKVTLAETSSHGPGLASRTCLYLAWRGTADGRLNVMCSLDEGRTFGFKYVADEWSPAAPCLGVHSHQNQVDQLYLGWVGVGTPKLNVARYV
jgi:hypothetical protein